MITKYIIEILIWTSVFCYSLNFVKVEKKFKSSNLTNSNKTSHTLSKSQKFVVVGMKFEKNGKRAKEQNP